MNLPNLPSKLRHFDIIIVLLSKFKVQSIRHRVPSYIYLQVSSNFEGKKSNMYGRQTMVTTHDKISLPHSKLDTSFPSIVDKKILILSHHHTYLSINVASPPPFYPYSLYSRYIQQPHIRSKHHHPHLIQSLCSYPPPSVMRGPPITYPNLVTVSFFTSPWRQRNDIACQHP